MLKQTKELVCRRLSAIRRRNHYPLLLPHFRVAGHRLQSMDQPAQTIPDDLAGALLSCDGTLRLARVARRHRIAGSQLVRQRDLRRIILWRNSVAPQPPAVADIWQIVVSAHPQDAAVGLGGQILQPGRGGWGVFEIFSQAGWWRFRRDPADLPRIQFARDAEQELIARLSMVQLHRLEFPEAILRGYDPAEVNSGMSHSSDQRIVATIHRETARLVAGHPQANWLLPLSVSGHIDRRLARDAVLEELQQQQVSSQHISFYDEDPPPARGATDLASIIPGRVLQPVLTDIRRQLRWKLELCSVYYSLLDDKRIEELADHARRLGTGRASEMTWMMVD